jgi:small-conductance mechanosensitive channel
MEEIEVRVPHAVRVFALVTGVFIPLALVCFLMTAAYDGVEFEPLQLVGAAVAVGVGLGLVAASG